MDIENLDDPALGPRTGVELEAQETGCHFKDEDQMIFSVESSSEYLYFALWNTIKNVIYP